MRLRWRLTLIGGLPRPDLHQQPNAGNEVLKGFERKLTPITNMRSYKSLYYTELENIHIVVYIT